MDIDLTPQSEDEAYWFDFDGDPEPDPAKRVALLVAPCTPLIAEECNDKATPRMPAINGRFRGGRNLQMPRLNFGLYQRLVFQRCVKGWRNIMSQGQPLPYSEEHKAALSEKHRGLLQFGYEMADALGEMTVEQIEAERKTFRSVDQVQARPSEPELSDL